MYTLVRQVSQTIHEYIENKESNANKVAQQYFRKGLPRSPLDEALERESTELNTHWFQAPDSPSLLVAGDRNSMEL